MEASPQLQPLGRPAAAEPAAERSPLARARLHRRLTLEEAARRAGISAEELHWLEEGRIYRFADPDRAMLAAILVASALGVGHREALRLAGLPVPPRPLPEHPWRRLGAVAAVGAAAAALALAVVLARAGVRPATTAALTVAAAPAAPARAAAPLPPAWAVKVVVLNGDGNAVHARSVASRIQALSYRVVRVGRAGSPDYRRTQVFYPPGGRALARRLGRQLRAPLQPLPGGNDPRRLVVIVGSRR